MRGHDRLVLRTGPELSEAPHPLTVLGIYILPTMPTVGAIFKDTDLREQEVFETIITEYMTEPS